MTPIAFDKDVLRLQTGDCWAWCHWFSDVVFTGPSGTMASTSSSRAAPTIAHACMLLTAPCEGALRDASVVRSVGSRSIFWSLLVAYRRWLIESGLPSVSLQTRTRIHC